MRLEDDIAESLELRGWWYRAARRWLDVWDQTEDEIAREAITRRRGHCLDMALQTLPTERRRENRKKYKQQSRYSEGY